MDRKDGKDSEELPIAKVAQLQKEKWGRKLATRELADATHELKLRREPIQTTRKTELTDLEGRQEL